MKTFAVDFETFYSKDYSVVDMGVTAYVNDPRFDAYMVSIVGDDGFEWVGHPKDAPWDRIDGCIWVSHNAAFDEQVFDRIQLDGVVPPHIAPSDWWCTASMAVYLQAPRSLAGACKQLLGEFVDKSVRAQQLGRVASADELNADPALREYALQDSRRCLRLWAGFSDKWPQKERRLARLTYQWGVDGIHVDVAGATEDLASLLKQREEALAQIPWASTAAPLSVIALRKHCAALGVWTPDSFDQKNADAIRWEDELSDEHPFVKAVRTYRRTNVLGQKYQTLLARTRDGVFPYAMKYCGAAPTFRWSGDSGLNVQNLPRGELFGCDFRRRLVARPGHTFVICDLGQIEVRVLAYLAGNHGYLDKMRQGLNPYEAAAEHMYSPALLGGSGKGLKKRNPALYATTKAIVLGCGYSMGSRKFAETAPALTGGEYAPSLKEAEKAVELYRSSNQPVVQLWDALHNGMRQSLGDTYDVELPSGRTLRYFGVRRIGDKYTATKEMGGTADYFYGGKLAENATQAMARDVFADALLRVHDSGVGRIVWHVHDEVIVEVPVDRAQAASDEVRRLMCVPPDWCPTLPLDAESSISSHYCK